MALRYDLYAALAALTAEVLASTADAEAAAEDLVRAVGAGERGQHRPGHATRIGEFDDSRADLAAAVRAAAPDPYPRPLLRRPVLTVGSPAQY